MRDVPALLQDQHTRFAACQSSDSLRVFSRAVFVVVAVQSENPGAHPSQILVETPVRKCGGEPGLDPGVQNPTSLRPVVFRQSLKVLRPLEVRLGGMHTANGPVLDEALRGFGDHYRASIGQLRCGRNCHGATNAMPKRDDGIERQCLANARHRRDRFIADKTQRKSTGVFVRISKPQAVVCHHRKPGSDCQLLREFPPKLNATERVMKEKDGCSAIAPLIASHRPPGIKLSSFGGNPMFARRDSHRLFSASNSSSVRGQSAPSRRDRLRSARTLPPV